MDRREDLSIVDVTQVNLELTDAEHLCVLFPFCAPIGC